MIMSTLMKMALLSARKNWSKDMSKFTVTLLSILLTFTVAAHEDSPLFNQVHLQASAQMDVPNDELIVIMTVEMEANNAAELADNINETMDWAITRVKKHSAIQARTLSYNTYPVYDKKTLIGWRGNQQLELKSSDITKLTEMTGQLQQRLQIKGMRFSPTKQTRKKHEDVLIEEAMQAFKRRVEIVKKHMSEKNVRIVSLNINTGGDYPRPVRAETRMMAMDSMAVSAPAVEAGSSSITVTVSGSVQFF